MRFQYSVLLAPTVFASSAVLAVSLTLPARAGDAARTGPAASAAAASGPKMRVGTYNFYAYRPMNKFVPAMKKFKRHVDVAGLQEIGMPSRATWLRKDHSWGYYRPPALEQNPIIWRRSAFHYVSAKGVKIARARNLGNENPGGKAYKRNTYATVVHLRSVATGKQIAFINVHLMHGAIKRTRQYPHRPRTYRLYLAQLKGLIQTIKAQRAKPANNGGVYVTGDFNISYRPDAEDHKAQLPYASMRRIGMHSLWAHSWELAHGRGTLGTALYDEVWHTTRPVSQEILHKIKGSDHVPAVATYSLPR